MTKKITELTALATIAADDLLPIVDVSGTETKKATVAQVAYNSPQWVTPSMWNPGGTFRYIFGGSAIAANRSVTLPLLTANDTFVFANHPQTLQDKTIDAGDNVITGIVDACVDDAANIAGSKLAAATTSDPGSMSAADKTKIDGMQPQGSAVAVGALAIDWAQGGIFTKSISANSTFTFSNASSGRMVVVRVTSTGSYTVDWPTVLWAGGTPPTQTASGTDVYTFFHDGTNIYGSVVQDFS